MRVLLELVRIIVIFGLLGALAWTLISDIYSVSEITEHYSWLGAIAILILLFVFYRNKLQFSGWYKGKGNKKLPRAVSTSLIVVSFLLLGSPFVLDALLI